jgi:DNA-directed RNA polymerase omega subunit
MKQKELIHSLDMQKCVDVIGGRFDMVLIAAQRAREIKRGSAKHIPSGNTAVVVALEEIQAGKIDKAEYLGKLPMPARDRFERTR